MNTYLVIDNNDMPIMIINAVDESVVARAVSTLQKDLGKSYNYMPIPVMDQTTGNVSMHIFSTSVWEINEALIPVKVKIKNTINWSIDTRNNVIEALNILSKRADDLYNRIEESPIKYMNKQTIAELDDTVLKLHKLRRMVMRKEIHNEDNNQG